MNNYNQKLFETMNNNAPNLISKNIDDYFNKLLNDINNESVINNKPTFYTTYIEHNILLIVILVCIAIFLFFRYYSKVRSNDEEDEGDEGDGGEGDGGDGGNRGNRGNRGEKKKSDSKKKRKKIIKKHIDNELRSLYEERQLLENEKKSLLNIIDDLSNYNVKSDILTDTSISARVEGVMGGGRVGGGGGGGDGGGRGGGGGGRGIGVERGDIIEQYEEYNNDNYNQFLDINSSNITKVNNINIENPYI